MRGSRVKKLKSEIFPNPGRKFGGFYKAQKNRDALKKKIENLVTIHHEKVGE